MLLDDADPGTIPDAGVIKEASTDELSHLMAGERRSAILDALIRRMAEGFRPDRARTLTAAVHWRIAGRPDGRADVYELSIEEGRCAVSSVAHREPQLVFSIDATDFVRMVTGEVNAVALVLRGRLRSSGDMRLTARFPRLFDPFHP